MSISENDLIGTLVEATKRHDEMLNSYNQSVQKLFTEISQILSTLKTPASRAIAS